MEYRSPVCKARICRKSPLMFQHPSFILARRNNRHHFRVSSRVMPMPPGYTKVFGFAPTWCTKKIPRKKLRGIFLLLFSGKAGAWCSIRGENSSCRPFCVLNGKIPLRGIFRARGLQENVDKMGWSKRVKEYMRQGPGMPGAFIGRWKIVWGIQGKAGGMYAAPTEEAVRLVAEKGTQKDSADFGRRSSRRTTGKVICTPTWRTVKSSMGEYHFFL